MTEPSENQELPDPDQTRDSATPPAEQPPTPDSELDFGMAVAFAVPESTRHHAADSECSVGILIASKYKLLQPIGEGGMGSVWVAEQREPVKRKVAVKLIKTGMDSRSMLNRFEAERQALAIMDHPNIARVIDGGVSDGTPFFVMELVNGLPLGKFCDEAKLGIRDRLELFVQICQAVQHAHQKGIVHRDLKPANILVTIIDGRATPKIIDFGVAKALAGKLTDETLATQFGAVIGTLEYMAPEQAGYSGQDIDSRADIYSLGVILYELLTGFRPFEAKRLRRAAVDEMIRVIREEEPQRMSTRFSTDESSPSMAALRHTNPRSLTAILRGELDWVVLKALEKNRDRRYESANGFARDIQRYLASEPVEARPASAAYKTRKFIARNKVLVAAGSLLLLTMLAGIIGTSYGMISANKQTALAVKAQKAEAERAESEAAAKSEAIAQRKVAETALAAEQAANATVKQQLTQIKKSNQLLTNVFADLDPRGLERAGESVMDVIAKRLVKTAEELDDGVVGDPEAVTTMQIELAASLRGMGFAQLALPIAELVYEKSIADSGEESKASARATNLVGKCYMDLGKHDIALEYLETCLRISRKVLGENHRSTLAAMLNVAQANTNLGRRKQALTLLEQTHTQMKIHLPANDHATIVCQMDLAALYLDDGDAETSLKHWREAADVMRDKLGADHPHSLTARMNTCMALAKLGRYAEAIGVMDELLVQSRKDLGRDNPFTLKIGTNLVTLHGDSGDFSRASELAREVYQNQSRALGPNHQDTLLTGIKLAVFLQKNGEAAEAMKVLTDLEDKIKSSLGENSLIYASFALEMSVQLIAEGRYEKALAYIQSAVRIRAEIAGENHEQTEEARVAMANTLMQLSRLDEAISLLKGLCDRREQKFGADSFQLALTRSVLAEALRVSGKKEESLDMFEQAERVMFAVVGKNNPLSLDVRNNHALALLELRRHAEAIAIFEELVAYWTTNHGEKLPQTLLAMHNLVSALDEVDPSRAVKLGKKVYAILLDTRGAQNVQTLNAFNNLAQALFQSGEFAQATELYEKHIPDMVAVFGEEHPNTAIARVNNAASLVNQGRFDESLTYFQVAAPLQEKYLGIASHTNLMNQKQWIYAISRSSSASETGQRAAALFERLKGKIPDLQFHHFRIDVCGTLAAGGSPEPAIRILEDALKQTEESHGEDYGESIDLRLVLGRICRDCDQLEKSALFFAGLFEKAESVYGKESGEAASIRLHHGKLLLLTGDFETALGLLDQYVTWEMASVGESTAGFAGVLALLSKDLLVHKQFPPAEKYLRRCLSIRENLVKQNDPQVALWQVANCQSMLGESLMGQQKLEESEPLLAAGYSELVENEASIPLQGRMNLHDSARRLKDLNLLLNKPDEVSKFEQEMKKWLGNEE